MGDNYNLDGYLLIKNCIPIAHIEALEEKVSELIYKLTGFSCSIQDVKLTNFLQNNREIERQLYNEIRHYNWLINFSLHPSIIKPVNRLLNTHCALLNKIPFRIDLPFVTRELAVWHQDYFYVQGNKNIITAWIPMQDTKFENGCLMVMPGSHRLGVLEHKNTILDKRHYPSDIFKSNVKYIEMNKGDMLLFHSLLLHSSGINLSEKCRFSLQARYSPLNEETAEHMGALSPCVIE